MLLPLGMITLAVGPLLWRVARNRLWLWGVIDGFVFAALAGLIFFLILPHAFDNAGLLALACLISGLLIPTLCERLLRASEQTTHRVVMLISALGLAIHGMIDGAALRLADDGAITGLLGLAVVVHRLPMGLTLWWMVVPGYGPAAGWGVIGLLIGLTGLGYFFGSDVEAVLGSGAIPMAEAAMAGLLLHVLAHPIGTLRPTGQRQRRPVTSPPTAAERVGNLLGVGAVAVVVLSPVGEDHGLEPLLSGFTTALIIVAPVIIVLGGLFTFIPRQTTNRARRLDGLAAWSLLLFVVVASWPEPALFAPTDILPETAVLALGLGVAAFWGVSGARQGVRRLLRFLLPVGHRHSHGHDHDNDHDAHGHQHTSEHDDAVRKTSQTPADGIKP